MIIGRIPISFTMTPGATDPRWGLAVGQPCKFRANCLFLLMTSCLVAPRCTSYKLQIAWLSGGTVTHITETVRRHRVHVQARYHPSLPHGVAKALSNSSVKKHGSVLVHILLS